jgi:hypothetical protein
MNECALVATYHKTGTVWMATTFRRICTALDIRFAQPKKTGSPDVTPPVVIFDGRSFRRQDLRWLVEVDSFRIFHLIRDPRDVVISAMHYHRTSEEDWLHRPDEAFGGNTYQQALNRVADDRQGYIFEMDNITGMAIRNMLRWDYSRANSFECKYEDLIMDTQTELFGRVVRHLGFADAEIDICRKQFWDASIFGGKDRNRKPLHIRSGAARQWPSVFDRGLGEAFVERFGEALVTLGYEPDNSWVSRLPETQVREARVPRAAAS